MLATYRSWGLLVLGCMLATYRSYGACWTQLGAVYWQPTSLMGLVGPSLGLYVGNLQVLWGLLDPAWGCMLATYRSCGSSLGPARGCMLATYRSYLACWAQLGALWWQPTGLIGLVGPSLGLYVGNLQVLWGLLDPAWGCMLATYRSYGACWTQLGAVCWQPTATGLMGLVGPSLGLYVGNLQVLWGLLDPAWACMLAIYRSYGACWTQLGAVCWQPTGLMGLVGPSLGAVCWQPTGLMGLVGPSLGLYVGNLQVLWGLLDPAWGCMLATYMSYAGLMWLVGPCMLATYMSYGACWTQLGAVCWQPTGLMRLVGLSLGLYVGNLQVLFGLLDPALNLQVLWGLLDPAWACWTQLGAVCYRSYGGCWTQL